MGPQNRVSSELFDSRLLPLPEHIDDFIQVQNAPDTMSFLELRAYVARLREGGHREPRNRDNQHEPEQRFHRSIPSYQPAPIETTSDGAYRSPVTTRLFEWRSAL